jgi:hypothetical protein
MSADGETVHRANVSAIQKVFHAARDFRVMAAMPQHADNSYASPPYDGNATEGCLRTWQT